MSPDVTATLTILARAATPATLSRVLNQKATTSAGTAMRQGFLNAAARFGDVTGIAAPDVSPRVTRGIDMVSSRASARSAEGAPACRT